MNHQVMVPWKTIEEALVLIHNYTGKEDQQIWDDAGWTGSNTSYKFKDKGEAPLKALRSLQGVMTNNSVLQHAAAQVQTPPMIISPFSVEELVDLLLLLRGAALPDSNRQNLLKKIVQQLVRGD
jgi:hypothetical protein